MAVSGELTLILEDGTEVTHSQPGATFVQRGTMHAWENRGAQWARLISVVIDADPLVRKDTGFAPPEEVLKHWKRPEGGTPASEA